MSNKKNRGMYANYSVISHSAVCLNKLMDIFVKIFADYLIIPIVLAGGIIILSLQKAGRYEAWARAVMVGLVALWLAKIISLVYQGQRPFEALGVAPGATFLPNPGFPSDHALLVFTVTAVVWGATKNKILAATLLIASIAVAVGRVVALVHTPLDVIGGIFCALLAAMCVYGRQFFTSRR
jgi:membrane-associated phospholipid phosphatase